VTATDEHGHAVKHGCGRPEPKNRRPGPGNRPPPGSRDQATGGNRKRPGRRDKPGTTAAAARDGPGSAARNRDEPGFSFTPEPRGGPPGGYETWRLRTPGPGPDLI